VLSLVLSLVIVKRKRFVELLPICFLNALQGRGSIGDLAHSHYESVAQESSHHTGKEGWRCPEVSAACSEYYSV
jgi:hypothetical protein